MHVRKYKKAMEMHEKELTDIKTDKKGTQTFQIKHPNYNKHN